MKFALAFTPIFCTLALFGSAAATPAPAATPARAKPVDRRQDAAILGFASSEMSQNGISSLSLPSVSVPNGQSIASSVSDFVSTAEAALTTRSTTARVAAGTGIPPKDNSICSSVNYVRVCCPLGYSVVNLECYQSLNGNDVVINDAGSGGNSSSSSTSSSDHKGDGAASVKGTSAMALAISLCGIAYLTL